MQALIWLHRSRQMLGAYTTCQEMYQSGVTIIGTEITLQTLLPILRIRTLVQSVSYGAVAGSTSPGGADLRCAAGAHPSPRASPLGSGLSRLQVSNGELKQGKQARKREHPHRNGTERRMSETEWRSDAHDSPDGQADLHGLWLRKDYGNNFEILSYT